MCSDSNFAKSFFIIWLLFFGVQSISAQSSTCQHHDHPVKPLMFIENQNQFHENVNFKASLGGLNHVFLEDKTWTYLFYNKEEAKLLHDQMNNPQTVPTILHGHSYKVNFVNALDPQIGGSGKFDHHYNFYLGNNQSKWAGKVPAFQEIVYENIYENIDILTYSNHGQLKYDFVISPNADPSQIILEYTGVNDLFLKDGQLNVVTSVNTVQESKPYAFQMIDGNEIAIACEYQLLNNQVRFHFPEGYDRSHELIIDPEVLAATLSGTNGSDNYGHTATYDNGGNIYAGGISFGVGYPTTDGAFQETFSDGNWGVDICVSKFNPDGTSLIYATYIGGEDGDYPHSMVVDSDEQLCVYGSSTSLDYPISDNAFQTSFGGGDADIVITKLNIDGTALVGSTFVGGSETDGRNIMSLNPNYGEAYRGEINVDAQGNIFIASTSASDDFPVTSNAYQTTFNTDNTGFGDPQDGVVLKINGDLSTMYWATYLGADNADTAAGVRIDDFGNVFVTGIAGSENFPTSAGTLQPDWPGGQQSAYIAMISPEGSQLLNSTFWGTEGDDRSYFIDIDEDLIIHIYGQTSGEMPITPDTYFFNEGSSQFIAGFNYELTELEFSTVIGTGSSSGNEDFVPVAFMVDKCNGIYFSGYQADGGLPLTDDYISNAANTFYLAKLTPKAEELVFGSYYGNADHVDGGTSRFDKGGIVYQAVCSGDFSQMETNSDAWAPGQSIGWDVGVFKIDFEIETVTALSSVTPSTSGCIPLDIDFTYTGQDGVEFFWDFGDDATSTEENPTHTYTETGTYDVMLIAINDNTCNERDTFYLQIDALDNSSSISSLGICEGNNSAFLDAFTVGATYAWQDGNTNATYEATTAGVYWVDVSLDGCSRRDTFLVQSLSPFQIDLGPDLLFCDEYPDVTIDAQNPSAMGYIWNNGEVSQSITVNEGGLYWVGIEDDNGCITRDSILVAYTETPEVNLGPDTTLCAGQPVTLDATIPGATYTWQDLTTNPVYTSMFPGEYIVEVDLFSCIDTDTINIFAPTPMTLALGQDQSACDVESFVIDAFNPFAETYLWSDGTTGSTLTITEGGAYAVQITDAVNCVLNDTIEFVFGTTPVFDLPDTVLCEGETLVVDVGDIDGNYLWQDSSTQAVFSTSEEGTYWVEIEDEGCYGVDSMTLDISYEPGLALQSTDLDCFDICDGSIEAFLSSASSTFEFAWNNGSNTSNLTDLCAGTYLVTISDQYDCIYFDEITITSPPPLEFDVILEDIQCNGDANGMIEVTDAEGGVDPYLFAIDEEEATAVPFFNNLSGGDFEIVMTDNNGCTKTEIHSIYEPPAITIGAGEDIYIELGDDASINGAVVPIENQEIVWSPTDSLNCPTCPDPISIEPLVDVMYTMTVTDTITGCQHVDQMIVYVEKPRNVFIPNVFSPNLDGNNDLFTVYGDQSVRRILTLKIFNRWGALLFERNNFQPNEERLGWDGTFDGKVLNPSVFTYLVEVEFIDDYVEMYSGDISIVR